MRRVALAFLLLVAADVTARPPHKQAIVQHFGQFLPEKLNACTLCHLSEKTSGDEKPHNAFGKRLKALGSEWKAAGKNTDILRRWEAIADEDSDGDGIPNVLEILSGRAPGNASDRPTDVELANARRILADYRRKTSQYVWRPFEPVRRPEIPAVQDPTWCRNPIDRFIASERERHGLKPRPEAGRATLLRRVYLDLIGLTPTTEELHAFLSDESPGAYDRVVEKLLSSPRYGERWGRHWMDVWRYSDWAGWTDGGQIRDSQPHIWRWRDWIVESLNADKGYDRMILEMLAADELSPADESILRATGYLARNYKMLSREKWLQDTVDHTFLAFQGLTIGCARCHDHMYDPISQQEYYQVRAIFTPHQVRVDRVPGEPDIKKDGLPRVYDADLASPTYLLIRGDDRTPDKTPLQPGVPSILGGRIALSPVPLPRDAFAPDKREFVKREALAASKQAVDTAKENLRRAQQQLAGRSMPIAHLHSLANITQLAARNAALEEVRMAEAELSVAEAKQAALGAVLQVEALEEAGDAKSPRWREAAEKTVTMQRQANVLEAKRNVMLAELERRRAPKAQIAAADKKLEAARKSLTQVEAEQKKTVTTAYAPRVSKTYPTTSTGRRLAFAKWLASVDNPLSARVAVNHIWLRHFGQALAPSVFDFGRNGRLPTHAALLDWLAAEFMQPGNGAPAWSMKHLHRIIVLSATYRQSSSIGDWNANSQSAIHNPQSIDPDNTWYWRVMPRRLEAELVRDNVLHVAGQLDTTMSGPDIDHQRGLAVFRRSLYFRHAAEKQMEFLKLFDAASVTECYQRKESVIPQQALALANSELSIRMARLTARDLARTCGADPARFVTAAFERVLSRQPTSTETAECLAFLTQQAAEHAKTQSIKADDPTGKTPSSDPALRARENLIQVLFNHHEFVTVR